MRTITLIIVHCSANKAGSALRLADIDRYHRSLGWKGCGYHFVIPTDGTVEKGRPVERVGSHCRNHNRHSIGVCYIGGLASDGKTPADTRTPQQRAALRKLLEQLHREYPKAMDTRTPQQRAALRKLLEQLHREYPKALIVGHRDLNPRKACPCFDAVGEYSELRHK